MSPLQILAVDDEWAMLDRMVECIQELLPQAQIHSFQRPSQALRYGQENSIDLAFLDIQMGGMDGITLGRKLRDIHPTLNIIYITAYTEHAFDAYQVNASGYLLKPIDPSELERQLQCLRYPLPQGKRVRIRCFGNFDVFVDGERMDFRYEKTREVLAYLVDRCGASCTVSEIMVALWEDDNHSSYMQNLRKDLLDTLKKHDCEDILDRKRGQMALNMDMVDCDYYGWKQGNRQGENAYRGEYMSQYSWAEETHGMLEEKNT